MEHLPLGAAAALLLLRHHHLRPEPLRAAHLLLQIRAPGRRGRGSGRVL